MIETSQDLEISLIEDKIEIAVEAAKKAGIEILKFYGKEVELESKTDGSPLILGTMICLGRIGLLIPTGRLRKCLLVYQAIIIGLSIRAKRLEAMNLPYWEAHNSCTRFG